MIKWRGKRGIRDLVGLGLSDANVRELKAGKPILISGDQLGLKNTDIAIMYGKTEAAMVDELRKAGFDTPLIREDV